MRKRKEGGGPFFVFGDEKRKRKRKRDMGNKIGRIVLFKKSAKRPSLHKDATLTLVGASVFTLFNVFPGKVEEEERKNPYLAPKSLTRKKESRDSLLFSSLFFLDTF